MTDKERQIASAALRVFSRYGLKRATMNDVAEEAGVVRQTLYNVFANKDEVIHGTLLFYTEMLRARTLEEWTDAPDLAAKIDILFEHNVLTPFDAVQGSSDAGDLESGTYPATKAALEISSRELRALLLDLFKPFDAGLTRSGQSPETFATFVEATMMGLKHGTRDRDALVQNLATLKAVIINTTT